MSRCYIFGNRKKCLPGVYSMIGRGIGIPFRHGTGGGGTSIPPEIKESIVAWYSPYKQKLTNYDVIESYADDFTKWRIENTGVTSTQKKIVIAAGTELKYNVAYKGFGNSIAEFDIKYTGNAVIRYQYNKEDGTTGIITINRSGIYHLPASIKAQKNFGFYCNPQTVTEEATIEQLPTSILKDFSGNGNHAYLYGGKGKLNSGMGVYQEDFSINTWNKTSFVFDYSHDYIKAKFKTINAGYRNVTVSNSNVSLNSMKIKVIIKGNSKDNRIMYSYADENGAQKVYYINNGETGIVPKSIATKTNDFLVGFRYNENNGDDCEITITQIPDYPDQLCYDGKMYAVAYDMPILTDYTVMAERTWFEKEEYSAFISNSLGGIEEPNNGAFCVEIKSLNSFTTSSFGSLTSIGIPEKGITYQTKQSYNGNSINVGTKESNDILILGGRYFYKNDNVAGNTWNGCHGAIIVADRSFTEEEINWLKQNWDKI